MMNKIKRNPELAFAGLLIVGTLSYLTFEATLGGNLFIATNALLWWCTGFLAAYTLHTWFERQADSIIRQQHDFIIEIKSYLEALEIVKRDAKQQSKGKKSRKTVRKTAQSSTGKSQA